MGFKLHVFLSIFKNYSKNKLEHVLEKKKEEFIFFLKYTYIESAYI